MTPTDPTPAADTTPAADPTLVAPIVIERITIPQTIDAPDAADFVETVAVENAIRADAIGSDDLAWLPDEQLPNWLDAYKDMRWYVVRDAGRIVATGSYESRLDGDGASTAYVDVMVLPSHRRRGIGSALLAHVEEVARREGRTQAIAYVRSTGEAEPRLLPPTGAGSVGAGDAAVQLLQGAGWVLGQVVRCSRLALPVDEEALAGIRDRARAAAGDDYRLHTWVGRSPERWLDDLAALETRMSTDAPSGGVDEPEDVWTPERFRDAEEKALAGPRTRFTAVVEHVPTGRLAGFSQLEAPAERSRPAFQQDTLVLREHRGHRLGWLLKIATTDLLTAERPGHPGVFTFNAEENRPMLDVNEAVGFVPFEYEGVWSRRLRP
ncbi:GNAT family N-acetyltransferase [Frigoribacterium faeni]|uniref:GNAT family N-acetyltransferase n=1 Tax=Frigoribacterium faeni TaxID=145483 RepID=UPI001FADFAC7|nr:GNAT family N-acetyltransferase [Frigoribacterium faeni]MCJ0702242.1 GNAT family N-acetyltransferase [Frigoribacterium faeni]